MAIVSSNILGVNLTDTPDTAAHALGTRVNTTDGGEYIYVQANGAITQYDWVGIDENFQAASLTKAMADDGWFIGVAQVAFADNDYGWIAVRGSNVSGRFKTGCLPDVALYTSGSAGMLDDSSTSQTKIDGAVAVTTATASGDSSEVILTFPRSSTF